MLLCAAVALVSACSKGGDKGKPTNTVTLAGENYVIDHGVISYYGNHYGNDSENVLLNLYTKDETAEISLNIIVPDESNTLEPGTYNFGTAYEPFTILAEDSSVSEGGNGLDVTGGSITVAKSGNTFTITFNLDTEAGKLTGKCSKNLTWEDETEEDEGPTDYNSSLSGTVTVGEDDYTIVAGGMHYYGQFEPGEGANVDLEIVDESGDAGLRLTMYVPENEQELVAGTYAFNSNLQPLTIENGKASDNGMEAPVMGGTVTIVKSGDTYTITFNLTSEVGEITGTVTGTLDWINGNDTSARR